MSIKEIDIGLAADLGTLQRFPRIVANESWVRELAFSARFFSAQEALDHGFVSYVVENRDKAIGKALEIANVVAEKTPLAVQGTKVLLDYSRDHSIQDGLSHYPMFNSRIGLYSIVEFDSFADECMTPFKL
jgi:Delta3,5-Delta2,4-dienoyl-CoA isomerase